MQNELLSIGKMAEINNLTVATLRLYDELGLLHPRRKDPQSGYRYYDMAQNARLDMIAYMKELGMSLAEIADILKKEDITLIETILIRKNEQLHSQMRELKARHNAVERAIASVERYRKSPVKGTIALEYIDRRYLWGLPCRDNFYDTDIYAYERELMYLRQALMNRGFSHIHSYATGTSITRENFLAGRFEAKDVFVFLITAMWKISAMRRFLTAVCTLVFILTVTTTKYVTPTDFLKPVMPAVGTSAAITSAKF